MLAAVVVLLRSLRLICGGHRAVALENLALRQQLSVFRRTVRRPQLRTRDRLFWVLLAKAWRDWRTALIVVQPDTVVRWHRQWLRRRWTQRSTRTRPGRPSTPGAIQTLAEQMAAGGAWVGSPDEIAGRIARLQREFGGFEHASLQVNFNTMPYAEALASMRLFAGEVMPRFTA